MRLILSLLFLFSAHPASAQEKEESWKTIELEWEKVPDADGYEVRFTPTTAGGKARVFTTQDNKFSQLVPVGLYKLQIRAKAKGTDEWSEWSPASDFEVANKEVAPLFPADKAVIDATGKGKQEIEFRWSPVEKIREYTLKVWSDEKKDTPWIFTGKNTHKKLEVPPGRVYYWQVLFASADEVDYAQEPKTFSFSLQGEQLLAPEINEYVAGKPISWKSSAGAKAYKVKLFYRHLDEKEWSRVRDEKIEATSLATKLKPGQYKIEVVATSPKHADSLPGNAEFLVKPTLEDIQAAIAAR